VWIQVLGSGSNTGLPAWNEGSEATAPCRGTHATPIDALVLTCADPTASAVDRQEFER